MHTSSIPPPGKLVVMDLKPNFLNTCNDSYLTSPEWVLNDFALTSSNMPGSPPTLQKGMRTAALRRVAGGHVLCGVAGLDLFNRLRIAWRVLDVIGFVNDINDDEACGRRNIGSNEFASDHPDKIKTTQPQIIGPWTDAIWGPWAIGWEARSQISNFCPDKMLQFLSGLHLGSQNFQKNVRIVDIAIFAAQFCPDRQIGPSRARKRSVPLFWTSPASEKHNSSL